VALGSTNDSGGDAVQKTDLPATRTIVRQSRTTPPTAAELAAIQAEFDADPHLWRSMGNLARNVQTTMIGQLKGLPDVQEAVIRVTTQMHRDLAQPSDTPLEALLVTQVVLCWLDFHLMGLVCTQEFTRASFERQETCDRLLEARQRRYLRAIKALARVRRLASRVPLQINIGGQQVNVTSEQ